jgi:energy-coupling factor transport system substrate-specific component
VIRLIAAAGALFALLGFFLPWVSYEQATYGGFDLAQSIAPALEAIPAGGLKGFNLALLLVPVLALISLACILVSHFARAGSGGTREAAWAAAAGVAGLAISALFIASALLPGTPGTQFSPGLVRTDLAVKTTAATTLKAGAFVGLGMGVYLTFAGFVAATIASALALRDAAAARAGGDAELGASNVRAAWRTQDYVLLGILAVVFGALYWWWLQPWLGAAALVPGAAQVGQELAFGMWFVSGLLGGYIIRRPGAAFLGETLAAFAEVLLGAPAGPILVVTGIMQALGPELVFAATGYRHWGWRTMLLAGLAAGLVALPWNWFRLGYFALPPALLLGLLATRLVGGALAGALAKLLGDALARAGALSYYPIGRERMREV